MHHECKKFMAPSSSKDYQWNCVPRFMKNFLTLQTKGGDPQRCSVFQQDSASTYFHADVQKQNVPTIFTKKYE